MMNTGASAATDENTRHAVFNRDEGEEIFQCYFRGTYFPSHIRWHSAGMQDLPDSPIVNVLVYLLMFGVPIAIGVIIGYWFFT